MSWSEFKALSERATQSRTHARSTSACASDAPVANEVDIPVQHNVHVFQSKRLRGLERREFKKIDSSVLQSLSTIRSIGHMQSKQQEALAKQAQTERLQRRRDHSAHFLTSDQMNIVEQALQAAHRSRGQSDKKGEQRRKRKAKAESENDVRRKRKHWNLCGNYCRMRACCFLDAPEDAFSVEDVWQGHEQMNNTRKVHERYQQILDMLRHLPKKKYVVKNRMCCVQCFKNYYGITVTTIVR